MDKLYKWNPDDLEVLECLKCKHWMGVERCSAFPNGIPLVILKMDTKHRKPYKGDNGIRFEPIK